MTTLQKGDKNKQVKELQQLLVGVGLQLKPDGDFGKNTLAKVKAFQKNNGLNISGIADNDTWELLKKLNNNSFSMGIKTYSLSTKEYMKEIFPKKTIYLHHTAGGPRPDYTIDWWKKDGGKKADGTKKHLRVGTAFVIGRKGNKDGDKFDGKTYRCFHEKYWAHHLGINSKKSHLKPSEILKMNQESIGIEICNYGYLEKINGEYFYVGVNHKAHVPKEDVCILRKPWRGHRFFEKYTEKQLEETKRIILTMAHMYNIPLPKMKYDRNWFDLKHDALMGKPGLWTHVNVRIDKTDCYPSPELIKMLNTLHKESKTFKPDFREEVVIAARGLKKRKRPSKKEIMHYSRDLD